MQHGFLMNAVILLAVRLKTIEERRGRRGHPLAAAPNDRLSAFAPTSAHSRKFIRASRRGARDSNSDCVKDEDLRLRDSIRAQILEPRFERVACKAL